MSTKKLCSFWATDIALNLDLIGKEYGIDVAEKYFKEAAETSTNEVSLDLMAFLYGAYFVYKLVPAEAEACKSEAVEVSFGDSSKSCYLDPSKAASLQIEDRNKPRGRQDGWLEIEMGTFSTEKYSKVEVKLLVMNHNFGVVKADLLVRGIELRPLN